MKKSILRNINIICLLLVSITVSAIPDSCSNLFDSHGIATQGLSKLLSITNAQYQESKDICIIQQSSDITNWRTHPQIERWNLMLPANLKKHINAIIDICENQLGMKKRILPKKVKYAGVLFLGASLSKVVDRVSFYNEMLAKGKIDSKLKVSVLTGERKLDENAGESKQNFLKLVPVGKKALPLPTNELEMIKFVFHYLMPKKIKVEYLYSPKDAEHDRATTASTAIAWSKKIPQPSRQTYYLGISNQPYVVYQELVINGVLHQTGKKNVKVYVTGGEPSPQKNRENYAAVLLDTVAKIITHCNYFCSTRTILSKQ